MLHRALVAACAGLVIVSVIPAHAALTKDQFKCQKTAAKQSRVFFKKRYNALAKCHNAINAGNLPLSTDCEIEGKTQDKINTAAQKLADKITGACPNAVVTTLNFGGQCSGAATAAALAACEQQEHEAASDALIATAYGDNSPPKLCVGGIATGRICIADSQCPSGACLPYESARVCSDGACVLTDEEQTCTEALAKTLGKLADKRQKIVQSCKKKVAKDKLPLTTDCLADGQDKLDKAFDKTLETIRAACPSTVTSSLAFGGKCTRQLDTDSVAACGTCSVGRQADEATLVQHGSSARRGTASAKQITNVADCVGGPMSRCRMNDYL